MFRLVNGVVKISDRVRAARCMISHIKLEKPAYFSCSMRDFRILYILRGYQIRIAHRNGQNRA